MPRTPRRDAPGTHRLATLAAAVALAVPLSAGAVRIDYVLGVSVLRSDNIGLSATAPVDETVLAPSLRFNVEQTGSRLRLNASGNLQYLDYLDDTFDDGFRGSLSGQAHWTLIEERMDFAVEDYLSRQPIDTLLAFNPGNQQQTNVFVAGPSFYARFGAVTRGQFDLRYSNSRAEDTDTFDGDRYNAALRVLREFSRTRRLGLNVEATRADYDFAAPGIDYTRYDGYLTYASELRRVDIALDGGYSRLEREDVPGSSSSPLFRGRLNWKFSPRSTLATNFSYEFADAAQDLITLTEGIGNPQVPISPNVYRQRRAELGYSFNGERFDANAGSYYQRIDYIDATTPLDEDGYGGILEVGYRIRPRLTLSFLAAQDTRNFNDPAREDRDFTAGIGLGNEFTRNWSARLDLLRRQRNSSAPGQDYDENVLTVSISYRR